MTTDAQSKERSIPRNIGRYLIKAELGRGGMGAVYRAYDPRVERDVAIKVLPEEFLHDPMFRARFEREAKTVAGLDHPAVVPIHDYGNHEGQPYIVMRLMSGGTLSRRLKRAALPISEIALIFERVCGALHEAHKREIIHRDLKPSNILFDRYNHAYLSDFGMVSVAAEDMTLTGENAAVGTPGYMSPEQIQGKPIDKRSDVYSLGVVLFEMLTGRRPFQADTPAMIIVKQMTEDPPNVRDLKPQLPPAYGTLVKRMLSHDPEMRPPSAKDTVKYLQAIIDGSSPSNKQNSSAKRMKRDRGGGGTAVAPNPPAKPKKKPNLSPPPPTEISPSPATEISPQPETPPSPAPIPKQESQETPSTLSVTFDVAHRVTCPNCRGIIELDEVEDGFTCPHCDNQYEVDGHLCPTCFTYHEEDVALCAHCSYPLTRVCQKCYAVNWSGREVCRQCGANIDIIASLQIPATKGVAERLQKRQKRAHELKNAEGASSEKRMIELRHIEQERERLEQQEAQKKKRREMSLLLAVIVMLAIAAVAVFFVVL